LGEGQPARSDEAQHAAGPVAKVVDGFTRASDALQECCGMTPVIGACDGLIQRWGYEKAGQKIEVSVDGPLTVDDFELGLGLGIVWIPEPWARRAILEGQLVPLLEDWTRAPPDATTVAGRDGLDE
jgi:hypothetical protein